MTTLNSALTISSIYSLATFLAIPWLAEESFQLWKATQRYDAQHYIAQERISGLSLYARIFAIIIGYVPGICMVLTLLDATWIDEWSRKPPILRTLVNAILLCLLAFQAIQRLLIQRSSKKKFARLNNFEAWKGASTLNKLFHATQSATESMLFSTSANLGIALSSISLIIFLQIYLKMSFILLAGFFGFFAYTASLAMPPLYNDTVSFRAMVIIPATLLFLIAAVFASITLSGTFYSIDYIFEKSHVGSLEEVVTNNLAAMYLPLFWSIVSYFPSALVQLAYRYDMVQLQETIAIDTSHREPMGVISTSNKKLPTYKTALSTLIGIQVIGIAVTIMGDYTSIPLAVYINIWPTIAYPIVLLAITLSITLQSKRSLQSLWSYSESWQTINKGDESIRLIPKTKCQPKLDTKDEQQDSISFQSTEIGKSFKQSNKVTCSFIFASGHSILYGSDDGVHLEKVGVISHPPKLLLSISGVTQIALVGDDATLVLMARECLYAFTFDGSSLQGSFDDKSKGRLIADNISYFRVDQCLGKEMLCIVHTVTGSSSYKVIETTSITTDQSQESFESLKMIKEFTVPMQSTDTNLLKTKVCIVGIQDYQIVDLETLQREALLESSDSNLDFIKQQAIECKPMAMYRIQGRFILCFNKFAFYIDRNGNRSKSQKRIG